MFAAAQSEQLSSTELAPCREQDDETKPVRHRGGKRLDLCERRDRTFGHALGPTAGDLARGCEEEAISDSGSHDRREEAVRLRRGARVRLGELGVPAAHLRGSEARKTDRTELRENVVIEQVPVELTCPDRKVSATLQPLVRVRLQAHFSGARIDPSSVVDVGFGDQQERKRVRLRRERLGYVVHPTLMAICRLPTSGRPATNRAEMAFAHIVLLGYRE